MKDFADGLVEGRPLRTSLPAPDDELGDLAVSFKRTGAQLRDLVDRLSLESARREAILASMVEGVLAVEMGAVAEDVALTIHPHPTLSETVGEAAEVLVGSATHVLPRKE